MRNDGMEFDELFAALTSYALLVDAVVFHTLVLAVHVAAPGMHKL